MELGKETRSRLATPEGVIDLTRDGKACLLAHAKAGWERWLLAADKRGGNGNLEWKDYTHYVGAHRRWWAYKVPLQRSIAM